MIRRLIFIPSIVFALALCSLNCDRKSAIPLVCSSSAQCPSHYVCAQSQGICIAARSCTTKTDCCPGQKCFNGLCADVAECDKNNPCIGNDFQCIDGICRRTNCTDNTNCTFPNSCVQGFCLIDLPCNGNCGDDEVCLSPLDECLKKEATCPGVSCDPGFIATVSDPYQMIGAICVNHQPVCECVKSPNLPPGKYGPYARIGIDVGTTPVIAAYDKTYGDLVFIELNNKQQPAKLVYVDGFPKTGKVVYDPTGPRNGIVDPGDDVGLELAMVTGPNGYVAISYYDRTNKNLKLAYRTASGQQWVILTLDTALKVGRYSSMFLDSSGRLHLAYFVEEDQNGETGVRYAVSKNQTPTSGADFTGTWVTRVKKPQLSTPCDNSCFDDQVCVELAGVQTCRKVDTAPCSPTCGPGSSCVDKECRVELRPLPEVDRFPIGLGLWTSIAVKNDVAFISFYDNIEGNLIAAKGTITSGFQSFILDGQKGDGTDTGDTGRFTSIAIAPNGTLGIAYQNVDDGWLMLWTGADLDSGTSEIVDKGNEQTVRAMVGADARLLFGPIDGDPRIAYQDSTFNDLKYARKNGQSWQIQTPLADGAVGYYVDQVFSGPNALVSSLEIKLDEKLDLQYWIRVAIVPLN